MSRLNTHIKTMSDAAPVVFDKILLSTPYAILTDTYMAPSVYARNLPIFVELDECCMSEFTADEKRTSAVLYFERSYTNAGSWFQTFDTVMKNLILKNADDWFTTTMSTDIINDAFIPTAQVHTKFNKSCYAVHINVEDNVPMFDENSVAITRDQILADTKIIPTVEMVGVKFTQKYFQVEMNLRQVRISRLNNLFKNCIIMNTLDRA